MLPSSPETVEALSYPDFVGVIRETNRCPGGKQTVNRIARLVGPDASSRILEVGCSTGFTSFELATITRSRVTGIDIAAAAITEAKRLQSLYPAEIAERVTFERCDLRMAPSLYDPFDLVIAGGATSFMNEKQEALEAYRRLLKPFGMLSLTNLFYHTIPPAEMISEVSQAIGTAIEIRDARAWVRLFAGTGLEIYHVETHRLKPRPTSDIETYVARMVDQPHLAVLDRATREAVHARWLRTMVAFNNNHAYLGYVLVLLRNNPLGEQTELFFAEDRFDLDGET
ncbi:MULTISPECIES: class I SAM-dependent methyltransferase [unclassified Bradyrhizobium]|uniref:class I SAM-dependent methyltransferase n=1 Tax=unclassified Bradyrhizobium TaxID=2631580 RepID=UPI002916C004|nr:MULTISPECIES: methyltransferase domain-containing protein [unclassified Bradyrhizobium]